MRRQLALGFPVLVGLEFKLQIWVNEYRLVCSAELGIERRRGFLHIFYGTVWVWRWEGTYTLHVHVHVFMLPAHVCMRICISILCLIGSLFLQRRRKRKSACNESIYFMELPWRGAGEQDLCKKTGSCCWEGDINLVFIFVHKWRWPHKPRPHKLPVEESGPLV